jgi:hypothetical protein
MVKFRKNEKTGNEEIFVRILPIAPVKVAGAWCRGKGKNGAINLYLDSSAWDPATQTFNGPDPVQELGIAKPNFKYVVYCVDIAHLGTLNKLGVASDRYAAYEEGAEMTWHPYRVLEISNTLMGQINNIRSLKGSASDPTTGYVMSIVRSSANNKVTYQVIPGDAYPINAEVLNDLARLQMPDIRQYHEPQPLHEQLKTLLFCGCTSYDKVISVLEGYRAAGVVKQEDYAVTLKGMTTYASARGLIGEGGAATLAAPGLPAPGTLAAPGLPAPGMGLPQVPAVAAALALPTMPAAPAVPALPAPAAPAIPAAPALPAAPAIPAAPQLPAAPAIPAAPALPAPPALPSIPAMAAPQLPGLSPAPPALPAIPGLLPGLPVAQTGMLE